MSGGFLVLLDERTAAAAEGGAAIVTACSVDVVLSPHVASVGHLVNALQTAEGEDGVEHALDHEALAHVCLVVFWKLWVWWRTGPLQLDGVWPARRALMLPKVMQGHMNAVQPAKHLGSVPSAGYAVALAAYMFRRDCSSPPADASSQTFLFTFQVYLGGRSRMETVFIAARKSQRDSCQSSRRART